MREKLIELLESTVPKEEVAAYGEVYVSTKRIADHLIANGVTIPVRCKDCKKKRKYHQKTPVCYCIHHERYMVEDDFCSYGEKR